MLRFAISTFDYFINYDGIEMLELWWREKYTNVAEVKRLKTLISKNIL